MDFTRARNNCVFDCVKMNNNGDYDGDVCGTGAAGVAYDIGDVDVGNNNQIWGALKPLNSFMKVIELDSDHYEFDGVLSESQNEERLRQYLHLIEKNHFSIKKMAISLR